jgi:hypothetical protein
MRTAEFVVPTFGYGIRLIVGYRVVVSSMSEKMDAGRIELPVGDLGSVRAPAEAIAEAQLLLVDPIGGAVDRRRGSIASQRNRFARGEVLDEDVVVANVGDSRAVRRELREHQARGRRLAANLRQLPAPQVEDPVVSAGVIAPYLDGVGENEEPLPISRPLVIVNIEACASDGHVLTTTRINRDELRCRNQHRTRPGRRLVPDDLRAAASALDDRVCLTVGQPARRAEAWRIVFVRLENAIDLGRERRGWFGLPAVNRGGGSDATGEEKRQPLTLHSSTPI